MPMVANPQPRYLSPEEYLVQEETNLIKHEYRNGIAYPMLDFIDAPTQAMAGATDVHVTLMLNLATLLKPHLRGSNCRVLVAAMKVRIEAANLYYYPDVLVTCDDRDQSNPTFKQYPCLIVEVLSDSTEAFDRGDKFLDYQELETLQEYVLISQKRQRVECFRRNEAGLWVLHLFRPGEIVELQSVNFQGAIESLYEDITFASPASQQL